MTGASAASSARSPAPTATRKAFKCNLCGGAPACAEACPTAAITYEDVMTGDWLGDFARERTERVLTGVR
jgi:ferredoxin